MSERQINAVSAVPTASYEAEPGSVHRVLLLYSGGLDTSVMLKWIQDEYEAEVVCLTVNLGQPGEDYEVIEGKALALGALECHVVDAREQFASDYVAPAIKANALYGGGYPLVHGARAAVDRKARRRLRAHVRLRTRSRMAARARATTRCGSEGTIATLAPELKVIAPVRSWQMGREEEIAYRARAWHPGQGRHRGGRRTRSTTTSGGAPRRGAGSRTSITRRRTTSSSS